MKITKEDLKSHGIDPKLYDDFDMEIIGESADKILNGELPVLLSHIERRIEREEKFKEEATLKRQEFNGDLQRISSHLDSIISLCSSKNSIFSSGLSAEETDRILIGTAAIYHKIEDEIQRARDHLAEMHGYLHELSEIQFIYSRKLYNAGMLNAAMAVINPEVSREDISRASRIAFEMFNDLTECVNDLNDRAIIDDEAINRKLARYLNELVEVMDFDGDGAKLNTKDAVNVIYKAKQMIRDVIER